MRLTTGVGRSNTRRQREGTNAMTSQAHENTLAMNRAGWILSLIVIVFLILDCAAIFIEIAPLKRATAEIGFPLGQMWLIGVLELVCLVLYAIPATCALGAILLTGFLGGAIMAHLRVASALTPEMIVSLAVGVLAWGGLWGRDPRFRALVPLRRDAATSSAAAAAQDGG